MAKGILTAAERELDRKIRRALDRVAESKAKRQARYERQRITSGRSASFLEGATDLPGGAHTDLEAARQPDTPTSPPSFLPTSAAVTTPQVRTVTVWAPQPGPQYHFIHCPVTDVVYGGARGGGKAVRRSQKIRGATGVSVCVGDLAVGDEIMHPSGAAQLVEGIYPQGVRRVWRFRLEGGLEADSSEDHLWLVSTEQPWSDRLATTLDVLDWLDAGVDVWLPVVVDDAGPTKKVRIEGAEYAGEDECVCIKVSDPSGLFVLENGVVTHNTYALIGDAAIRAAIYGSAFRGLFLRRQQTELLDVKAKMREVYLPLGAVWSEQHQTWTFPGGGVLILKYLMNDDDALMYKGWNVTALYVDEIGDFPNRKTIDLLWGAMRSAKGIPVVRRMSCNPGGPGHCLRHGEVLTPLGWVDVADVREGDPVYTVTASGEMVESVVSQKHVHQHDGDLVRVRARGLFVECTPNHRVAKVGGDGKTLDGANINRKKHAAPRFSLVPFEKLPGQATILRSVSWTGAPIGEFVLPVTGVRARRPKLRQPMRLPGERYAEFMGWFLSEGCASPRYGRFDIAQTKPVTRRRVEDMLKRCGFAYRETKTGFSVHSRAWADYLARYGKCREKHVPAAVKGATPAELRLFLDAAMDGDGHWVRRGLSGEYYTTSRRLADDVAEIALKLGHVVHVSSRQRPGREGDSYCVSLKTVKSGGTEILTGNHVYGVGTKTKRRSDVKRVPYSGPVYCIGVEGTHSFVVRQNGSVWVSGNSWVKRLYLDHGPYRVFRYAPNEDRPDLTMDAVFIPATLEDNKLLIGNDPQYEVKLAASCGGDKALYEAWRYGKWDSLAGTYFQFSEKKSVMVPPPMPDYVRRWVSIDWGYTHPSAVLWWAEYGERTWIYRERLYTNTDPVTLGMFIAEVNGDERTEEVVLSPDAFARRTSEQTIAMDLLEGFRRAHEMRGCALLPEPTPADNDRVNGWQALAAGFEHGALLISPDCPELVRTIQGLVRDPKRPNDVQKVDGDDMCLAAGMKVLMANGPDVAIEDLEPGDLVQTACGPGEVTAVACTSPSAELIEVMLEDGRVIRGTPGHHLFDGEGRRKRLLEFVAGDTITVWTQPPNPSGSTAAHSGDTPGPSVGAVGTTSGPKTAQNADSIGPSGQPHTDPSRPAGTSTTSMVIPPTTLSRTSLPHPAESTPESTGSARGRSPWVMRSSAATAEPPSSTTEDTENASSAGTPASRLRAGRLVLMTSTASARRAERASASIATSRFGIARVAAVVRLAERAPVFNITVDCCHTFFAEGILSANCDSARYGWMTRKRVIRKPFEMRAAEAVNAPDPNDRAMQERIFWAKERSAGFLGGGVNIRGGRRSLLRNFE